MKKLMLSLAFIASTFALKAQDFSIPIEGNAGYINFSDNSRFKDTWYVGGATGFDFTDNAGIRGYYWRALDDGQVDEFDNLEIYGAETKVKIPISKYAKPYLVVGGGLLKPFNNYVDANGQIENDNHFFGSAGGGLDLNFIRFISVTGYARAMFSDFEQINTLENDIATSWNYGASINFNIGDSGFKKKSNPNTTSVVMPEPVKNEVDVEKEVNKELEKKATEERIAELERRIKQLEEDKRRAEEREQLKKELREELMQEYEFKRSIEYDVIPEIQEIEIIETPTDDGAKKKIVELSKKNAELEQSIATLNEKISAIEKNAEVEVKVNDATIAELEAEIMQLETQKNKAVAQNEDTAKVEELEDTIVKLNKKISTLETIDVDADSQKEITDLQQEIKRLKNEQKKVTSLKEREYQMEMERLKQELEVERQATQLQEQKIEVEEVVEETPEEKLIDRELLLGARESLTREGFKSLLTETEVGKDDAMKDRLFYTHTDGFLAGGFGENDYAEPLVGVRPNFYIAGSKFRFAPEASVGFGKEMSVNVLANALYDFTASENLKPYVGVGGGFISPNGDFKPAINIALGSQFKSFANGKLSAEVSSRNLFKYNQVAVGYEIF